MKESGQIQRMKNELEVEYTKHKNYSQLQKCLRDQLLHECAPSEE